MVVALCAATNGRWTTTVRRKVLRSSGVFQSTMAKFAESFVGSPRVSVNEVLVEM
jgi:hypothetical protein